MSGLTTGLKHIRVIDFSNRIAGAYTSKMLADAGADVIKIEPKTGDPLRSRTATHADLGNEDSAFFKYLNTSKRSVIGSPNDSHVLSLIESADLIIETFEAGSEALAQFENLALDQRSPELVILSISSYGRTGPYANKAATEFTLQADSGSLSTRGLRSMPPLMAGGKITEYIGGTFAAVASLAAVTHAQKTGFGEVIDFSLAEVINLAGTTFSDLMSSLWGRPEVPGKLRSVEVPSIEPTKDQQWVGFATNSYQQYSDFLTMIGRADLLDQKDLDQAMGRSKRMNEWNEIVHAWTRNKTADEIIELAALFRIPVAPVNNGKTVLEHEHFKARNVFVKNPGGDFLQPRPPYQINGQSPFEFLAAPRLGEHQGKIESRTKQKTNNKPENNHLPLRGIRILDATAWWAGPAATQMLAHLGAEVIHLEAIQRPDGSRMMGGMYTHEESWWEYSAMFLSVNTNKSGLTLNLSDPEGIDIVKRLIKESDVFIENYSPRVMEKFGLDWETVHELNPQTIFIRMPAFGLDGPWKNHVGFAQTMEQITGMAWLTGFTEDQPRIQRGPCDPMAGMNAAFAALVAIEERKTTNKGCLIECSMVEGALNAAAEQSIEYSAYGNIMQRNGNRSPDAAPQGLYICANHDRKNEQWLALSIETDAQWQSLKKALGNPAWTEDSAFDTATGRQQQHDFIDHELQAFLQDKELSTILSDWERQSIPVAPVARSTQTYQHPQMIARHYLEEIEHPIVGKHLFVTTPFRFKSVDKWLHKPAPVVGEDNHAILRNIIGLTDSEIEQLEQQEVIGTRLKGV